MTSTGSPQDHSTNYMPDELAAGLPPGWLVGAPNSGDAPELTELLRRHEESARGWSSASEDDVLIAVSARGYITRENLILRDEAGTLRGWASAHDRAAGRMLLVVVVDPLLDSVTADTVAEVLLGWADLAAERVGRERELDVQQVDSGAFADDTRQHRWLEGAGFTKVRTWWQMSRPVSADEADLDSEVGEGVRIRQVERQGTGMPSEEDLRIVHDVLESAFADHFNSHEETFDEFVFRLREDPGHRWDHWWIAELVETAPDGSETVEPAGALVGVVQDAEGDQPAGSYVEYIGVLANARGRGVAKSLLATVIADAASRGRDRVGLEVDADSPTGADGLYVSMGWKTKYVTQSWHKDVPVPA
ncbi:MAG: GNAT family N-acetyltransferase [Nocardioides sp.]